MNHLRFSRACTVLLLGIPLVIAAAQGPPQRKIEPEPTRPPFLLRVSSEDLHSVSLKAVNAPIAQIARNLSKKLSVPVFVGPSIKNENITADFESLTLEPSLKQLAPVVFIDYEISSAPGVQPRAVGIYLYGYDDPPPSISEVVKGGSEILFIEGHTEDFGEGSGMEDGSLRVQFEKNNLSVRAKQQPLSLVVHRIASELGIPFEMKDDANDLIDINFDKVPLEDALQLISPNVRLYVQADLQKLNRRPFRIVLVNPPKS